MEEDILGNIAQTSPVDLSDLVVEKPLPSLPPSTDKHEAAKVAMLSASPLETYQNILVEGENNVTTTRDNIVREKSQSVKEEMKQGLMSILSDPKVTVEKKKQIVQNLQTSLPEPDTTSILANEAYKAESKGESAEQELVRISGAEVFGPVQQWNAEKNKILNSRKVELNGGSVADFLGMLLPFSTNVNTTRFIKDARKIVGTDIGLGKSALLPGSAMMELKKSFEQLPPEEKIRVAHEIDSLIANTPKILFEGNQTLTAVSQLRSIVNGDYSTFDKVVDNAVGVLDAIGVGSLLKGFKGASKAKAAAAITSDAPSPVSVLNTLQEANPDKARGAYTLIVKTEGDEAAEALAGTSKQGVVVDAHAPSQAVPDGSVKPKVQNMEETIKAITPDEDLILAYRDSLGKGYTKEEAVAAQRAVASSLESVTGIKLHENMIQVGEDAGELSIKAVYGTGEKGFLKPDEALNQVALSLREYGVKEADLQLMHKVDGEYVPTTLKEVAGKEGDYLVSLQLNKGIINSQVGEMSKLPVKWNWLDRIPVFRSLRSGTLANHLFDHASMLSKELTGKAVVQYDKGVALENLLVKKVDSFASEFNKLDKKQKDILFDIIQKANNEGAEYTPTMMRSMGADDKAISAMEKWRKTWDDMFWLENAVKGRQLSNRGFQILEAGDTRLFARPIAKNTNVGKVYDPSTDMVLTLSKQGMDDLYEKGGTLAKLNRAEEFDGELVDHVLVRNSPTEYLRGIRESDQVLNYRKGYYQVRYNAPKFITRTVKKSDGSTYTKAVAVAGDSKEAELIKQRYATKHQIPEEEMAVRSDVKDLKATEAYEWDLDHAAGRIAQRRRGKRLEGAEDNISLAFEKSYVADPLEAVTRAAGSISNRVAMGDFLEAAKERAKRQYGQFMKQDKGQTLWPSSSKMLRATENSQASDLADARTTVEYINYLEHGYHNSIDEGIKSGIKAVADMLGKFSPKAEKVALAAGEINPTQAVKSAAFWSYIAMSPLRQWVVQPHGVVRLSVMNPRAYMSALEDARKYFAAEVMGVKGNKETQAIVDFVNRSGSLDAVDKHNLIRGAITDMSYTRNPITKGVTDVLNVPRKYGFDNAEKTNTLIHMLWARQDAIGRGVDVSKASAMDDIHARARAIMGDMNFAGDMPYNQNALGAFMQFLQYPHKMILSVTANQRLSSVDKIKLLAADSALFGVPGYALLEQYVGKENLPEDQSLQHVLHKGVEDWAFNNAMTVLSGKPVNVDFASLSPYEADGFKKFADSMMMEGFGGLFKMSPSMAIFGPGGMLPETAQRIGRYLGLKETYDGEPVETVMSVAESAAEMARGWSAAKRAYVAYELGQLKDKDGMVIIDNYTAYHAILNSLGFRNKEELIWFKTTKALAEAQKSANEDIRQTVREHVRLLAREEGIHESPEKLGILLNVFNKMYADNPAALQKANEEITKEISNNKTQILNNLIKASMNPDVISQIKEISELGLIKDDGEIQKTLNIVKRMDEESKKLREEK